MHLKSQAHESYWNRTGTDCLDFFLLAAAYEQILKQKYSTFFQQTIIPALPHYSPYPSSWKPHLTYNSVPFEPARNIQGCYQQIRFAFEPVGPSAGKKADPFNQILPTSFVDSIAASGLYPALDLTSWHHFKNEFFIAESDIKILQAQMLGEGVDVDVPPTCFFAFDLPRNTFALTLQPYLFPHRRAFFERKTITEVVFDAVRKLDSLELSLLPALSQVEDLVTSRGNTVVSDMGSFTPNLTGAEKEISVEMLSIDCIDPATARIKMYGKTNDTSFANVRDIYTFGGKRRSEEVSEGSSSSQRVLETAAWPS
jgi:DMATS type aromatic prenyltransferase